MVEAFAQRIFVIINLILQKRQQVCKHKESYLKVCDATSNINVTLKDHCEDGVRAGIIPVANFDCIGYVEVHCKYYLVASGIRSNTNV